MTGQDGGALEVIWPLHRWHYLSPALTDEGLVMHPEPESSEDHAAACLGAADHGRELAARALLAGPAGSQQQVSDLLGVSRRTVGRLADVDRTTAVRDPQVLEAARTCLAETASRGSTAEERAAAVAWLQEAARDERQIVRVQASRQPAARRPGAGRRLTRTCAKPTGAASPTAAPHVPPLSPQVEALRRQQQRILHRTALIAYVLTAEQRNGGPLTMRKQCTVDTAHGARRGGQSLQFDDCVAWQCVTGPPRRLPT
jgi:hypothetical protein